MLCHAIAVLAPFVGAAAHADFRACNETEHRIGLALAHSTGDAWISEGWWMIDAHACATILAGPLKARFYYMHARHFDVGGGWIGDRYFCTTQRSFSIMGREKCQARGFERTGFIEIDTHDAADYTHKLTAAVQ